MKSKMVKKMLTALLVATMSLGVVGCGSSANSETTGGNTVATDSSEVSTEEASTQESSVEEDLGAYSIRTDVNGNKIDLGGIEIIVRDFNAGDGTRPEATDAFTEAKYEYLDWAQETYNFTIKEMAMGDWGSCIQDLVDYVAVGGDENYYLFHMRTADEVFSAINSDLVYDVATLDCVDFTEDKWVDAVSELYGKGDSIYGFRSYNISNALGGRGMYFNKRILQEAGIDPQNLYEWQESGEWTWKKFEELCATVEADTDNDGVIDRYAMAGPKNVWFTMSVYSNAGNFIGKDKSGKFYNDLESNATMEALNWANGIWNTYDAHKAYPEDAAWNYWETVFMNGEAAFSAAELWRAGSIDSTLVDDFGFVCYPKGPNATEYANVCSDAAYYLPACYDEEKAWKIMFAYDLYTEPVPGFEDFAPWRSGFYQQFKDTEAVDYTVTRLMKYARPAYDTSVPGASPDDVINGITEDNTPAQQAEILRPTWEALIDKVNK